MNLKKKHLIIIGVFVVVLAGLAVFLNRFVFINPFETYSRNFKYEVKKCENGGPKNDSMIITTLDNSIKFNQILNTYCNADKDNLKLKYSREGNNLEINEIFKSALVTECVCPLEIKGTISNLEKRRYMLDFIFDNRHINQKVTIDTHEFEIK